MVNEIERKALALVNEVAKTGSVGRIGLHHWTTIYKALCRAIEQHEAEKAARAADREQHEAFRQEVSAACEKWTKENVNCREPHDLDRFILPKSDPLVEAVGDAMQAHEVYSKYELTDSLRAALAARGLKIVEDK